jgi:hypothetical protein
MPSDDLSKISYLSEYLILSISFVSNALVEKWRSPGRFWILIRSLIRLNTTLTSSGRFTVYANLPDANGVETRIGYDGAVCVERYQPWIVEAFNTSVGFPTILRIVEKGYGSTSLPSGKLRG